MATVYFTAREREVLKGILEGKSSKEVADKLFLSKRTVDFHLHNIYEKLHVSTRMQAALKVQQLNIVL